MRKIRKPKKTPGHITLSFDLIGTDKENISMYMWLKAQELTVLPATMQALFQCETASRTAAQVADEFDGLLAPSDLPVLEQPTAVSEEAS